MTSVKKNIAPIVHPSEAGVTCDVPEDLMSPAMGVPRMTSVTNAAAPKKEEDNMLSPMSPAPGVKRMVSVTAAVAPAPEQDGIGNRRSCPNISGHHSW
eukprot:TRINITY_DN71_c3_g1_i1.p1 TRINITY_DN71_c3_g1~~TRINITY_DN71_c3_g1_i1.p1  ORF type:complete len:113 (+),score=26.69 TRINITY_DN71_c3_g1_i1:46-339(+)